MGQQDGPWTDTATWDWQCPGLEEPSREQGTKECHQSWIIEATWCPDTACLFPHSLSPKPESKKQLSLRAAQKHQLETPESALREHGMLKQGCLLFLLRVSVRKEINICLGYFEAKIWNYGCAEANTPGYFLGERKNSTSVSFHRYVPRALRAVLQIIFPSTDV